LVRFFLYYFTRQEQQQTGEKMGTNYDSKRKKGNKIKNGKTILFDVSHINFYFISFDFLFYCLRRILSIESKRHTTKTRSRFDFYGMGVSFPSGYYFFLSISFRSSSKLTLPIFFCFSRGREKKWLKKKSVRRAPMSIPGE
jgi:hypothetical protein